MGCVSGDGREELEGGRARTRHEAVRRARGCAADSAARRVAEVVCVCGAEEQWRWRASFSFARAVGAGGALRICAHGGGRGGQEGTDAVLMLLLPGRQGCGAPRAWSWLAGFCVRGSSARARGEGLQLQQQVGRVGGRGSAVGGWSEADCKCRAQTRNARRGCAVCLRAGLLRALPGEGAAEWSWVCR